MAEKSITSTTDTETQLAAMFGGVPDGHVATLFCLPSRFTTRHRPQDSARMAQQAQSRAQEADVYTGVYTLSEHNGPKKGRGSAADVTGLVGLWVDLDIAHAGDKTDGHPPDMAVALEILSAAPVPPSLVVHSGHGIQPFWCFDEAWMLPDAATREAAWALCRDWVGLFQATAGGLGYTVDHAKDITRVLRVAGTINHKHGEQVDVRLLSHDAERAYKPSELREMTPRSSRAVSVSRSQPGPPLADIVVDREGGVDPLRYGSLLENHEGFKKAYSGKTAFNSASERDMALANYCAAADWPPQEIANLIVGLRVERREDLKHYGYYQQTIAKAFESAIAAAARRQLVGDEAADSDGPDLISAGIGVPVLAVKRYGEENPHYALVVQPEGQEPKEVRIGTATELFGSQNALRGRIGAAINGAPFLKAKRNDIEAWIDLVMRAAVLHDVDNGEGDQIREWIQDYLIASGEADELLLKPQYEWTREDHEAYRQKVSAAILGSAPVMLDDRLYLNLGAFVRWLHSRGDKPTEALNAAFRAMGWEPHKLQVRDGEGRMRSGRFWRSPPNWFNQK